MATSTPAKIRQSSHRLHRLSAKEGITNRRANANRTFKLSPPPDLLPELGRVLVAGGKLRRFIAAQLLLAYRVWSAYRILRPMPDPPPRHAFPHYQRKTPV